MKDLKAQAIRNWTTEFKLAISAGREVDEEELPFKSFHKQYIHAKSVLESLHEGSSRNVITRLAMEEARMLFVLRYEYVYADRVPFKHKWIRETYLEFMSGE